MIQLTKYLYNSYITEMALGISDYKNKLLDYSEQIIQNWILVYYCHHYNKDNINCKHWESELKSQFAFFYNKKIKVPNRLNKIKDIFINKLELNTYSGVYLMVENKLRKENLTELIIHQLVLDTNNNINEICELINNINKDNSIDLIENI